MKKLLLTLFHGIVFRKKDRLPNDRPPVRVKTIFNPRVTGDVKLVCGGCKCKTDIQRIRYGDTKATAGVPFCSSICMDWYAAESRLQSIPF